MTYLLALFLLWLIINKTLPYSEFMYHVIRFHKKPCNISDSEFNMDAIKIQKILGLTKPCQVYLVKNIFGNRFKLLNLFSYILHGKDYLNQTDKTGGYCKRITTVLFHLKGTIIYVVTTCPLYDPNDPDGNRRIISILAHELYHAYQAELDKWNSEDAEIEAEAFSTAYLSYKHLTIYKYVENVGRIALDGAGQLKCLDGTWNKPGWEKFYNLYTKYLNEYFS